MFLHGAVQMHVHVINCLVQSTLIIPTLDTTTKFVILAIWLARKLSLKRWQFIRNSAVTILFSTSSNICFGYLIALPHRGDSNKYRKHMVYKEIKLNMTFVAYYLTHWEFFTTANSFKWQSLVEQMLSLYRGFTVKRPMAAFWFDLQISSR